MYVLDNVVAPGLSGAVIVISNISLSVGNIYTVRTAIGNITLTLPDISTVTEGQFLDIEDGDNLAATHNITINTFSIADSIYYFNSSTKTFVMNINSSVIRLVRSNGLWRVIKL
jgi:hypothetical protein